jgi:hypothetical protein
MKIFVAATMLIALYLLFRIAFSKKPETKQGNFTPQNRDADISKVVVKSRFVRPVRGQPQTTHTTPLKTDIQEEKPFIFAPENAQRDAVIPAEKLDELFADDFNPDELDIPPDDDDDNDDEIEIDAEAEEETERMGHEAMLAAGLDFDDLQHVAQVVKEQPETVSRETGAKIAELEHTDMFETLVSGNDGSTALTNQGKMNWIKSVIERHIQNNEPETESEVSETDNSNFDIAEFLGKPMKH